MGWQDGKPVDNSGPAWKQGTPVNTAPAGAAGAPEAGSFDFAGSARRTGGQIYDHFIEGQIIPAAMSYAATKLPAVAVRGVPTMIAAPIVEGIYQGTAGYLADKANQALDISPPGEEQAITQGGIQGTIAMGQKAYRVLNPWTGRKGAVRANEVAVTEGRQQIAKHTPQNESSVLFDEAAKEGANVPMNNTMGLVNDYVNKVFRNDPTATTGNLKSKLRQYYGDVGETIYTLWKGDMRNMPSDRWQFHHSRLGSKLGGMRNAGNTHGSGEASKLYESMYADLEQVAEAEVRPQNTGIVTGGSPNGSMAPPPRDMSRPQLEGTVEPPRPEGDLATSSPLPQPAAAVEQSLGATKLKAALNTFRKEKTVERMQDAIVDANKLLKGQGLDRQFNARPVIDELLDEKSFTGKMFHKSFNPEERKEIIDILGHLNTAPNLPAPSSLNVGGKRVIERAMATLAGHQVGGLAGAAAGFGSKDIADMAHNLAFALGTKAGRAMIRELNQSPGGLFNGRSLSVLSAYATAMKNQPTQE